MMKVNILVLKWLQKTIEFPQDELEAVLESAAAGNNNTVIIALVNRAYVVEVGEGRTMLDLFLESFWEGEGTLPLLDHLVLVATDHTAYQWRIHVVQGGCSCHHEIFFLLRFVLTKRKLHP